MKVQFSYDKEVKNVFQFVFISAHDHIQYYWESRHNWYLPSLHGVYVWLFPYSNLEMLKLNYQELNLHITVGHHASGQKQFCGKDLLYKCSLMHYGSN